MSQKNGRMPLLLVFTCFFGLNAVVLSDKATIYGLLADPSAVPEDAERISIPANHIQQLITRLFQGYNKEAVLDMPTVIHMDVLLLKVKNTIEKEGIFESVIALMIEWYDRRMTWNPNEYGNLTFLSLTTDQVWLPDIAMTNSADHLYSISRDNRFTVRVSYDGLFKFVPTGTAKTWCDLKLLTFPFDIQQCSLEFESWSLDSKTMTFDGKSELLVDSSFASTQFQLCEHKAVTYYHTYNFTVNGTVIGGETFTRVRFEFTVKRKSTFYVINLIFPCATLSLIQLLVFVIPSNETTADRIGFGTTNLLTLVVFQTIVTEEMPKSDAVTALSKYIIALIIMSAVGIFESVIVERLLGRTLSKPPSWLVALLKYVPIVLRETPAARQLRLESLASKSLSSNPLDEPDKTPHKRKPLKKYQLKAVLDKYCITSSAASPDSNTGEFTTDSAPPYSHEGNDVSPAAAAIEIKINNEKYEEEAEADGGSNKRNSTSSNKVDFLSSTNTYAGSFIMEDDSRRDSYQLAVTTGKLSRSFFTQRNRNCVRPSASSLSFQPSLLSATNCHTFLSFNEDKPTADFICGCDEPHQNGHVPHNSPSCFSLKNPTSPSSARRPRKLFGKLLRRKLSPFGHSGGDGDEDGPPLSAVRLRQRRNATASSLWAEIAFKLDFITLCICGTMAFAVPCAMFLPLVSIESGICGSQ